MKFEVYKFHLHPFTSSKKRTFWTSDQQECHNPLFGFIELLLSPWQLDLMWKRVETGRWRCSRGSWQLQAALWLEFDCKPQFLYSHSILGKLENIWRTYGKSCPKLDVPCMFLRQWPTELGSLFAKPQRGRRWNHMYIYLYHNITLRIHAPKPSKHVNCMSSFHIGPLDTFLATTNDWTILDHLLKRRKKTGKETEELQSVQPHDIWVNYNDLTTTSPQIMARIRGIFPKRPNYSGQ